MNDTNNRTYIKSIRSYKGFLWIEGALQDLRCSSFLLKIESGGYCLSLSLCFGRDVKKLKENVHAIQVGCENYGGAHLSKECLLHKKDHRAKKEADHDEWLRKFQETTKINQKGHDEIIRNLKTKLKTLTGEVEGRLAETKKGECKEIFTKEGLPLYTPFYYYPKKIEYFSVNSSLSDKEVQDETKEDEEINDEAAHHKPTDQMVTPCNP
ncbi:hypothetical protein Tco_1485533 [Tanacetum coccineum]